MSNRIEQNTYYPTRELWDQYESNTHLFRNVHFINTGLLLIPVDNVI